MIPTTNRLMSSFDASLAAPYVYLDSAPKQSAKRNSASLSRLVRELFRTTEIYTLRS
jgi:hypothetical protein